MMVDDLDGYGSTLAQMGGEDGYSLFPKSDYQGDGSRLSLISGVHVGALHVPACTCKCMQACGRVGAYSKVHKIR